MASSACRLRQGGLHVGGGGLGLFAGGGDAAADAAPEVDLVVEVERELKVGDAVVAVGGVEVGTVGGVAHAADGGRDADGGEAAGAVVRGSGAGLAEAGFGCLERLIFGGDLRLKRLSSASPKMVHQSPRRTVSAGWAGCQLASSLKLLAGRAPASL